MCYNGFSKALTAAVLFRASSSFDKAVTMPGCNVSNLLSAIGPEGLTMLWHQLTVFAWTVALSQVHHPAHCDCRNDCHLNGMLSQNSTCMQVVCLGNWVLG